MHVIQRLLSGNPTTAPFMRYLAYLRNDVFKPGVVDIMISQMVPGWQDMTIVEAGCGPGYKVRDPRFKGISITCVDVYKPYLKTCRGYGFKTVHADLKNIDTIFEKGSFDIVLFIDVIEHFTKREGLRVLKKLESKEGIMVTTLDMKKVNRIKSYFND